MARDLTIRERREMGLTIPNILRATREMVREGLLTRQTSQEDVRDLILERMVFENPKAYANPEVDWDAILAFIEKLLPIILAFIQALSLLAAAGTTVAVLLVALCLTGSAQAQCVATQCVGPRMIAVDTAIVVAADPLVVEDSVLVAPIATVRPVRRVLTVHPLRTTVHTVIVRQPVRNTVRFIFGRRVVPVEAGL